MAAHAASGSLPAAGHHAHHSASGPALIAATVGPEVDRRYEVLAKIGEGTYGVVYLAAARDGSGKLYAIKTFKPGREGEGISHTAIREISLLRELSHESVVRLAAVHICRAPPSLSLAFDYADHDLHELICYHKDRLHAPLDWYTIKSIMWQLLNGLSYLHQNWIIHRDLKPSNLLLVSEGPEAGGLKVADFGLARLLRAPLRPLSENGVVVTIWYRAPELLLGARHYGRAVDCWAAGCILAELMLLRPLFQGAERKGPGVPFQGDQLDRVFRVLGHPSPATWPTLEQLPHWADNTDNIRIQRPEWAAPRLAGHLAEAWSATTEAWRQQGVALNPTTAPQAPCLWPHPAVLSLLSGLLAYDPAQRLTAQQALAHEWFTTPPLPGRNALVCNGRRVTQLPRKHSIKQLQEAAAQREAQATAMALQQQQQQQAAAAAGAHGAAAGMLPATGYQPLPIPLLQGILPPSLPLPAAGAMSGPAAGAGAPDGGAADAQGAAAAAGGGAGAGGARGHKGARGRGLPPAGAGQRRGAGNKGGGAAGAGGGGGNKKRLGGGASGTNKRSHR